MRVTIEKLAYGGDGIARPAPDEPVVFVPRTAPGDVVEVEIVEQKPRFRRGRVLEVIQPGPDRVEPPCGHYQRASEAASCGGCHYQHFRYPAQFTQKILHVREALKRLGGMELDETKAALWPGSGAKPEDAFGYRNKGTFHWDAEAGAFGLVAMDGHTIVRVPSCPLLAPPVSRIHEAAAGAAEAIARDDAAVRAALLSLVVRAGTATGDTLAALVVKPGAPENLGPRFAEAVASRCAPTSLQLNVNASPDRALFGPRFELLAGAPAIREKIGALTFVLDAETFVQVNTAQAKRLYDEAVALAGARGGGPTPRTILDLYAGNGGLSLSLAAAFPSAEVTAIESVAPAVARGRESAAANGLTNVRWRVGRVESTLKKLHHSERIRPDLVVVDPPRAGLKEGVVDLIARMKPGRVVYVSCNPTTLARDVKAFAARGYRASKDRLAVVDLFPQTFHVEAVLALTPSDRAASASR